jgi:hypothetical protein
VIVRLGSQPERSEDPKLVKTKHHFLQVRCGLHVLNVFEHRLGRRQAELVDPRLIHARAVVIADQLFHAAAGPIRAARDVVEDVLQLVLGLFARLPAATPAVHIGWNGILLVPGAIRVL